MSSQNKPRIVAGVKLGLVLVSPEWQPRAALDTEHIRDLHETLTAGRSVPALDVVEIEDGYALVDGYHRHAAMLAVGTRTCEVRVVAKGDRDTARWWSYAANRGHGLKRTNADKRRSVRDALRHAFAGDMSNADVAEHCGVGLTLIAEVRKEMEAPAPKVAADAAAVAAATEETARVARGEKPRTVREVAEATGTSKSAVARALSRSTGANDRDKNTRDPSPVTDAGGLRGGYTEPLEAPLSGATLAERSAAHAEVARVLAKAARDIEVIGGGMLPTSSAQQIDVWLGKARAEALLSSPVPCPAHTPGASCMACRGAGWVTQATANQIERAS